MKNPGAFCEFLILFYKLTVSLKWVKIAWNIHFQIRMKGAFLTPRFLVVFFWLVHLPGNDFPRVVFVQESLQRFYAPEIGSQQHRPKQVLVEESNYKTEAQNNVPFHNTGEEGYFLLELTED